jgi:hypothetical protein
MSKSVEFPLQSLRQFMLPDQTVKLKTFEAKDVQQLDVQINTWVKQTNNIIAIPGPLVTTSEGVTLSLTFVEAAEGITNG